MSEFGWTEAHFARALQLKREVCDGLRSPHSCIKALEREFPDLGPSRVTALWERAWWDGIEYPRPKKRAR